MKTLAEAITIYEEGKWHNPLDFKPENFILIWIFCGRTKDQLVGKFTGKEYVTTGDGVVEKEDLNYWCYFHLNGEMFLPENPY